MPYRKIASLRKASDFLAYLTGLGIGLPFDEQLITGDSSPLSAPAQVDGLAIGNRFCILPMEGWDGTPDGKPTEYTIRRWKRFGQSGAKLIWGGEAAAVRHDGRANPNQLLINDQNLASLSGLRQDLVAGHMAAHGSVDGLVIGLQLTHSGRYSRPNEKKRPEPRLGFDHPFLNSRVGLPQKSQAVFTDNELDDLVVDFIKAAGLAQQAGFDFVDIKHCHGYLLHELLSAVERPGRYGGSFENRTLFVRSVVAGIRQAVPGLKIGVRLSAFDFMPFHPGGDGVGEPDWGDWPPGRYPYAFGGDGAGLGIDLTEPMAFLDLLASLNVHLICITGGSPYTNPHIQRPAIFPPSDGYQPPEDPLIGVHRQIQATAQLKVHAPESFLVGSAYTYLQEWLPFVAQAAVRQGLVDSIGLGRMVLAYPSLPADVLAGRGLQRKLFCRSFSDCTTAPRNGMISGCYPLDELYKNLPEAQKLEALKIGS
ncbi:MAG TPA: hypothetical protein VF326_08705 [Anaerolineaceae bacterium]|jgi:NADPH2 dehydrogenase